MTTITSNPTTKTKIAFLKAKKLASEKGITRAFSQVKPYKTCGYEAQVIRKTLILIKDAQYLGLNWKDVQSYTTLRRRVRDAKGLKIHVILDRLTHDEKVQMYNALSDYFETCV